LIDSEAVSSRRIFEPSNEFNQVDQDTLDRALSEVADPRQSLVWFIDDLPRFCPGDEQLQRLARWLDRLDECGNLYVIATGRSDDIDRNPDLKTWLKDKRFELVK
jgi:hypothetical protein